MRPHPGWRWLPWIGAIIQDRDRLRETLSRARSEPDDRCRWMHHHPPSLFPPSAAVTTQFREPSIALVERLVTAFRSQDAASQYGADSQWKQIAESRQRKLLRTLAEGSTDVIADLLAHPEGNYLFYGFEDLYEGRAEQYRDNPAIAAAWAQRCHDILVRLAEAVGALRVENPESDVHWGKNCDLSADAVVDLVERQVGIALSCPPVHAGFWGLRTKRGVLTERMLNGFYSAWRARELTCRVQAPRILEIGAGLGWTAYYAYQLGMRDYTIVDLPLTNVAQGYFLANALGPDAVALQHETGRNGRITITTRPRLGSLRPERYDLAINVDSLTEVGAGVARDYARLCAERCDRLLSINHEINSFTAHRVLQQEAPRARMQRHPHWLRSGYVEEVLDYS